MAPPVASPAPMTSTAFFCVMAALSPAIILNCMKPVSVQFLFDFGSPNAYLSHVLIPSIEKRTGARFEYLPILLGGLFKLTGNRSPAQAYAGIKNKLEYERLESARFVERHGIAAFKRNPFFPVNTLQIMRGALAARKDGCFEKYIDA